MQVKSRIRADLARHSQADIVIREAHASKGVAFVDVNVAPRAVGYFVVTLIVEPTRTRKRERKGKKAQYGRGLHSGEFQNW